MAAPLPGNLLGMIINGEESQVNGGEKKKKKRKEILRKKNQNFGQLRMNISHLRLIRNEHYRFDV